MTGRLDGVITIWRRQAEQLLGYAAPEIVGTDFERIVPPERRGEELDLGDGSDRAGHVFHYETARRARRREPWQEMMDRRFCDGLPRHAASGQHRNSMRGKAASPPHQRAASETSHKHEGEPPSVAISTALAYVDRRHEKARLPLLRALGPVVTVPDSFRLGCAPAVHRSRC